MNKEKMRIAMIGCGRFCDWFVELFQKHPVVEEVFVCDKRPERAKAYSEKYATKIIDTFEEVLERDDINAVAIFTPRTTHAEFVIRALEAGKHVYSSVPCAVDVEDIKKIAELVKKTRLTYSMGETGYYRAAAIYCRREFKKGTFGNFVYAESQYNHDIRNMEDSFQSSGGDRWKEYAGVPPFFYPTHSTSMILSCLPGVYATKVAAFGYEDPRHDIYGTDGQNLYQNPFGNESMLIKLSNGGVARVSENRCVGWHCPATYLTQFYGNEGGYEFSVAKHHQAVWNPESNKRVIMKDVTKELVPPHVYELIQKDYDDAIGQIAGGLGFWEASPIQPEDTLPEEYKGLRNGHDGTHKFLIDDFCRAYETGKLSPTNIWQVARYSMPGLIAHQSALAGGVLMDVPDLGDPPADFEVLDRFADK